MAARRPRQQKIRIPPPIKISQPPPVQIPLMASGSDGNMYGAAFGPSTTNLSQAVLGGQATPAEVEVAKAAENSAADKVVTAATKGLRAANYESTLWAALTTPLRAAKESAAATVDLMHGDFGRAVHEAGSAIKEGLQTGAGLVAAGTEASTMGAIPATEIPGVSSGAVARAWRGEANYNPSVMMEWAARKSEADARGVPMGDIKWEDVSSDRKNAARAGGFALDTLGDPLTYLSGGTNVAVKQGAEALAKEAVVVTTKEAAAAASKEAAKTLASSAIKYEAQKAGHYVVSQAEKEAAKGGNLFRDGVKIQTHDLGNGMVALTNNGRSLNPTEAKWLQGAATKAGHGEQAVRAWNPVEFSNRFGYKAMRHVGDTTGQWASWESKLNGLKLGNKVSGHWTAEGIMKSAEGGLQVHIPRVSRTGRGLKPLAPGRSIEKVVTQPLARAIHGPPEAERQVAAKLLEAITGHAVSEVKAPRPFISGVMDTAAKVNQAFGRMAGAEAALRQGFRRGENAANPIARDLMVQSMRAFKATQHGAARELARTLSQGFDGVSQESWQNRYMPYLHARSELGALSDHPQVMRDLMQADVAAKAGNDVVETKAIARARTQITDERALSRMDRAAAGKLSGDDIATMRRYLGANLSPDELSTVARIDAAQAAAHKYYLERMSALGATGIPARENYGFYFKPSAAKYREGKDLGLGMHDVDRILRGDMPEKLSEKQRAWARQQGTSMEKLGRTEYRRTGTPLGELEQDFSKIVNAQINRYAQDIADTHLYSSLDKLWAGGNPVIKAAPLKQVIGRDLTRRELSEAHTAWVIAARAGLAWQRAEEEVGAVRQWIDNAHLAQGGIDENQALAAANVLASAERNARKASSRYGAAEERFRGVYAKISGNAGPESTKAAVSDLTDAYVTSMTSTTKAERQRLRKAMRNSLLTDAGTAGGAERVSRKAKREAGKVGATFEGATTKADTAAERARSQVLGAETAARPKIELASQRGAKRAGSVADVIRGDLERSAAGAQGRAAGLAGRVGAEQEKIIRAIDSISPTVSKALAQQKVKGEQAVARAGKKATPEAAARAGKVADAGQKVIDRAFNSAYAKAERSGRVNDALILAMADTNAKRADAAIERTTTRLLRAAGITDEATTATAMRAVDRLRYSSLSGVNNMDEAVSRQLESVGVRMQGSIDSIVATADKVAKTTAAAKSTHEYAVTIQRGIERAAREQDRVVQPNDYNAFIKGMESSMGNVKPETAQARKRLLARLGNTRTAIGEAIQTRNEAASELQTEGLNILERVAEATPSPREGLQFGYVNLPKLDIRPLQPTIDTMLQRGLDAPINTYIESFRNAVKAPDWIKDVMNIYRGTFYVDPRFTLRNAQSDILAVISRGLISPKEYLGEVWRMIVGGGRHGKTKYYDETYKRLGAKFDWLGGRMGRQRTESVTTRMYQAGEENRTGLLEFATLKGRETNNPALRVVGKGWNGVKRFTQASFSFEDNITSLAYASILERKGLSSDAVANEILYTLKDYSELSRFMQAARHYVTPFVAYRLQNLALQWDIFKRNPGLYIHLYSELPDLISQFSGDTRTWKQRVEGSVALPGGRVWETRDVLPQADFLQVLGGAGLTANEPGISGPQRIGMVAGSQFRGPAVSALSGAVGFDPETGQEISPRPKEFLGVKMPGRVAYLAKNAVPGVNAATKVAGVVTSVGKGIGVGPGAESKARPEALLGLLGIQVKTPEDQAKLQAGAYKRQLAEILAQMEYEGRLQPVLRQPATPKPKAPKAQRTTGGTSKGRGASVRTSSKGRGKIRASGGGARTPKRGSKRRRPVRIPTSGR
jgi:hypothetical protein